MSDLKNDKGKLQWHRLPWDAMGEFLRVIEYGDSIYARDNWRSGSPPERYWDAAMRHMIAWHNGEKFDPDSSLHHFAHAAVSLIYAMVLDRPENLKALYSSVCGAVLTSGSEVVICQGQPGHTGRCHP